MKKNSAVLVIATLAAVLVAAYPVLADTNQNADLTGGSGTVVKVVQVAWNYGNGDINQHANILVTGNYQYVDQDSLIIADDADNDTLVNNTFHGINLIKVDLDQYAKNYGSGKVSQGIDVKVEGNIQYLDQRALEIIEG